MSSRSYVNLGANLWRAPVYGYGSRIEKDIFGQNLGFGENKLGSKIVCKGRGQGYNKREGGSIVCKGRGQGYNKREGGSQSTDQSAHESFVNESS
jgi:hypothetical protein